MIIRREYDTRGVNAFQSISTKLIATVAGAGYSPVAPGTAGTLIGCLVLFILEPDFSSVLFLVAIAVVYAIGVLVSSWAERVWEKSDPGQVCIDELAGLLVSLAYVPAKDPALLLVAAFLLFRMFDIIKPPPARAAENARSGWGIMNDDMIAGLYTNAALQIISRLGWL